MVTARMSDPTILPVIMSGGAGSRLWPLSRQALPKQLLALVTDNTMAQETVTRTTGAAFHDPVFICNALHAAPIGQQMTDLGRRSGAIITEPMGRNTAPVAVVAALAAQAVSDDTLVLLVPADHHVRHPQAFRDVVTAALPAARDGRLVTFGITPDRPETGYGYIQMSDPLYEGVHRVATFREKPDRATAQAYIDGGDYVWNAGIFLFSPKAFLAEIDRFAPDILTQSRRAYERAVTADEVTSLDAESFAACPSESIDYAVMEKTDKAAVAPCNMGWSDIGSFASLHEVTRQRDGNATKGDVISIDTTNSLILSDGPLVTTVGIDNLAVIVHDGRVLVAHLDAAQDVKKIVEQLKAKGRTDDL